MATIASVRRIWQRKHVQKERPLALLRREYVSAFGIRRYKYYLKAMNCPYHHKIFAATPKSYRDLPIRLAEYGTCYRHEKSVELFGLMRVRML